MCAVHAPNVDRPQVLFLVASSTDRRPPTRQCDSRQLTDVLFLHFLFSIICSTGCYLSHGPGYIGAFCGNFLPHYCGNDGAWCTLAILLLYGFYVGWMAFMLAAGTGYTNGDNNVVMTLFMAVFFTTVFIAAIGISTFVKNDETTRREDEAKRAKEMKAAGAE